ncbi:MAG: membrane-associated zinc metalloprotease [Parcubacteria group bacterium Licking1014_1]|nr:MAG: membrane-associated zinc metalloprotease [Parcubacteria group bacterium Licking1014_1]
MIKNYKIKNLIISYYHSLHFFSICVILKLNNMDIFITIFSLIVLLFSVIIHELAHGSVAYSLGDPTAKYDGRLTLNPLKHLDPFGSIILPLLLFAGGSPMLIGWAKPVPINPHNFKDQKWGTLKVAIAGPSSNMAVALFFGLLLRAVPLDFFAMAPGMFLIFSFTVWINIILAIFNLLPIPPLDGSWILLRFLPDRFEKTKIFLHQYGLFILIFFIFFGGLSGLGALAHFLYNIMVGASFSLF